MLKGVDFSALVCPHCLSANNDKGYDGIGCIKLASHRIESARVVVITTVTDYAT